MMVSRTKETPVKQIFNLRLLLWSAIFLFTSTEAFSFSHVHPKVDCRISRVGFTYDPNSFRQMATVPLTRLNISSGTEIEVAKLVDRNNNEFTEGCTVRVNSATLKAYQVPSSGYGYYDENKVFVKNTDKSDSSKQCLAIPEGLHGVVIRVYNIIDLGPNFPIKVKFEKGLTDEEGYTPPVTFMMHFDTVEVDVV